VLTCAIATIARDATRTAALAGIGFAVLSAGCVTTLCFNQLTTELHASAAPWVLAQLS